MAKLTSLRARAPSRREMAAAVLAGCGAALGQAPWSLWPISLIGFIGIFVLLLRTKGAVTSAWIGWLAGSGFFAISLFWIVEPFLVDIVRHGWMAPFALLFMSTGLALFWGLAAAMSAIAPSIFLRSILAPALLTLSEMLRGIVFTGFPWALPGYIWSDHALMQVSAWVGPYGVTVFTLLLCALIALSIFKKAKGPAVISLISFCSLWVMADNRIPQTFNQDTEKTARLLQPNAAQHLKWQPDMIPVFFEGQLAMSRDAHTQGVELIVWPEMSIGYRLNQTPAALDMIAEAANGVPVIFGGNSVIDDKFRNTLASMGTDGTIRDWYYKHHLVPFGEYIPLGELLGRFGIRGLAARDGAGYDVGDGPKLFEVEGIGNVLPLICYELIFPRHLRTPTRPDLILQATNDAWFGNISGPYQHLAQARFRAVEQGIAVIRSANTGISAAIDPYGRIIAQLPLNEAGYLDVPIQKALPPTPYSKTGDTPLFIFLLAVVAGIGVVSAVRGRHV